MSLLRRIEGQRPAGQQPAAPAPGTPPPPGGPPKPPSEGPLTQSASPTRDANRDIRIKLQTRIINNLDPRLDLADAKAVRSSIEEMFNKFIDEEGVVVTRVERQKMLESILDEILGFGPIEPLLKDDTITEVMVNGPFRCYVERKGKLQLSDVTFQSDEHVMRIVERIIAPIGRRVDESKPYEDARLPDGSRVNIIIPPLALNGPTVTIRKFPKYRITVEDYIKFGTATAEMMEFMRACVEARLNMFISGGTGSGKTTLLNILSSFIPETERLITCEDAAELQLQQPHWIQLESRPPNVEGKGAVPIRELVKSCLRMRPDRIIVGECRGGEALDMLQAMNTGHDGSMSTLHANNPKECLVRLETLVLQAGQDLPSRAIRETIGSAIHLIVQQSRLRGGVRRIVSVAEVLGVKDGEVQFQELFQFKQIGVNSEGKAVGYHTATGVLPVRMEHLKSEGEDVPESLFIPTPQPPPDKLY